MRKNWRIFDTKTLYLDIKFESDCQFRWEVAPIGTNNYRCGCYSYHDERDAWDNSCVDVAVERYKNIIKQFYDNVEENGYENWVRRNLTKALNQKWDKDFCVKEDTTDWYIFVKFYIEDKDSSVPYTFNLTQEQIDDITYIMHTVYNYEDIGESKLKNMAVDKMITAWYNYTSDKYNQRKDNSYDRQDLTDALDELYSHQDGAAYDTLQSRDKLKTIEYYIDNHSEKTSYTFYLTDEQATELNYIGLHIDDMPSGVSSEEYKSEIINYLIKFYKENHK